MTPTQSQIQDQLQRKHEELQQLIVHQQEELRRVSEQLLMARYGLLPSIVNVAMPINTVSQTIARTQSHSTTTVNMATHQSILQLENQANIDCNLNIEHIDNQENIPARNDDMISYMELASIRNTQIDQNPHHSQSSHHEQQSHQSAHIQQTQIHHPIHPQPHHSHVTQQHYISTQLQLEDHQTEHSQNEPSEIETLPYQLVEEHTQAPFPSTSNENI